MKNLQEILYKVATESVLGSTHIRISSISTDSRTNKKGSLYIAKKGTSLDGHDYINNAIKSGATRIGLAARSLGIFAPFETIWFILRQSGYLEDVQTHQHRIIRTKKIYNYFLYSSFN